MRHFLTAVFVCSLFFTGVTVAHADATVEVEVRGDSDGKVTLSSKSAGGSFSCNTKGGACKIASVPGGRYTVVFVAASGKATAPKKCHDSALGHG